MTRMQFLVTFSTACLVTSVAWADDKIFVQKKAVLDPGVSVDEELAKKCDVESLIGSRVFEQIKRRSPGAVSVESADVPSSEILVRTRITTVRALEAVDLKLLRVEAEILKGDSVLRWTEYRSRTMLQTTPEVGICALVDRMATQVGDRIAYWVPAALKVLARKAGESAPEK